MFGFLRANLQICFMALGLRRRASAERWCERSTGVLVIVVAEATMAMGGGIEEAVASLRSDKDDDASAEGSSYIECRRISDEANFSIRAL